MKALVPPQAQGGLPPEVQKMIEEGKATIQQLTTENEAMKADVQGKQQQMAMDGQKHAAEMEIKRLELEIEKRRLAIDEFSAQTDRIQAMKPEPPVVAPQGPPRKAA
jgi:predicted RNase H-like nuclease (RuvC/YqgF family)